MKNATVYSSVMSEENMSKDEFKNIVFTEGGAPVLILLLFSLASTCVCAPIILAIIDYESNINRQSTLLTKLQTATLRVYICWTPLAMVDIFRYLWWKSHQISPCMYRTKIKISGFQLESNWAHGFVPPICTQNTSWLKLHFSYLRWKQLLTTFLQEMRHFC